MLEKDMNEFIYAEIMCDTYVYINILNACISGEIGRSELCINKYKQCIIFFCAFPFS